MLTRVSLVSFCKSLPDQMRSTVYKHAASSLPLDLVDITPLRLRFYIEETRGCIRIRNVAVRSLFVQSIQLQQSLLLGFRNTTSLYKRCSSIECILKVSCICHCQASSRFTVTYTWLQTRTCNRTVSQAACARFQGRASWHRHASLDTSGVTMLEQPCQHAGRGREALVATAFCRETSSRRARMANALLHQ
jgi:hypothetical protein